MTDMRTRITFVGLPLTRGGGGDFYMSSGNVFVKACTFPEVFVTTLDFTVETRLLLDSCCHLGLLQLHEATICLDHGVV